MQTTGGIVSGLYGFSAQGAPVLGTSGTPSGGSTTSPSGGSTPGTGSSTPPVAATVVKQPPRFRTFGIAIGDAIDVTPTDAVTFPLTLELHFDPHEAAVKGVDPELIRVFYFDQASGTWSDRGITVTSIDRTDGLVQFETTHLTVFRLGIPRSQPPLIHHLRPSRVASGGAVALWGQGFNPAASRNVLTLGGAFVSLSLDAAGDPQSLGLDDQGETLILRDADGRELDHAELPAAPTSRASWVRHPEALGASPFVMHTTIATGRLFSPGTHTDGTSFAPQQAAPPRAPSAGNLLINEVLLAPPASFLGDANGDGETNPQEDEFVELVNTTDHALLLDGVVLVGRGGERHRFRTGTQLPGGMAWVLFGVDDPAHPPLPAGPFGGARFFPDTSAASRLIARVPPGTAAGTTFLTVTTLRQTSNPVSLQIVAPLGDHLPAFEDASAHLPPLTNRQLRVLRVADLDRDLDVDVIAVSRDAELSLLLNDGFGGFTVAADRITLPDGRNDFFDLALADLTGDGAPELLIGDTDASGSYTQLLIFENTGGGAFSLLHQTGVLSGPASSGPTAFDLGDVDQDGDLDVVVAIAGDQPIIFRNDGEARFAHLPGTDALPQEQVMVPTDVALADMDDDGDADVLLAAGRAGLGASRDVQLLLNEGTGRFEDVTDSHLPSASDGVDALAVGDLDADGDLDFVSGSKTRAPRMYLNDGTGHFTLGDAGALASARASSISLEDLNGDGNLDLVLSHPPRDQVFLNDGHASFSPLGPLPESPGNHREAAAFDADGDGDLDLLSVGPGLTLLRNTGTRRNQPPRLEPIAERAVIEGAELSFELVAHDADEDTVVITAALQSGEPLSSIGAVLTDHGDGTASFAWTPTAEQGSREGRRYAFVARASDGMATSEQSFVVIVREFNHRPVLEPLSPVTIEELVSVSITLHASDLDAGDVLTFGAVGRPPGSTLSASSGLFEWTPGPTQGNGPGGRRAYPLTFTVTDLAHDSANQEMTLTVLDVNHPPVFPLFDAQSVLEGQELALTITATDPDGDPVTVSELEPLPAGATFDASTRAFRWTPTFLQGRVAPYTARFRASANQLEATLELSITVLNVNRPPVFIGLTDQAIEEGQQLVFDVVAGDLDGDVLTLSVSGLPTGATFDAASGHFVWVPGASQTGDHAVTFGVTDGVNTIHHQTIHITVADVNHAPVIISVADQTVREGRLLQFAVNVSDADSDPLTVTVGSLPRGAQFFKQGAFWLFQWVPGSDQSGSYPLTVQATDGIIPNPVTGQLLVTVTDNPGFQRVAASVGFIEADTVPTSGVATAFGGVSLVTLAPGGSVVLDLGQVHPALVSMMDLFGSTPTVSLAEADIALFVSDDNQMYQPYAGPLVFSTAGNRAILSNLNIPQRYIKIHRIGAAAAGDITNILSEIARASGAISLTGAEEAQIEDLAHRTFLYFAENVNANGLIPDRVGVQNGQPVPGVVYSTAATGFWLSALPIAVEHGWITREQAQGFARRTLEFYLGQNGGPAAGQFGFYYHFLNADGTRFTGFGDDGVSILDSTLLFAGALACAEYFDGDIATLANQLVDRADWEAFFDHGVNMLRLFWTPEQGFLRHLDYYSEGLLSYVLAAGSTTHPVLPDADLPAGADGYYTFSRGDFGRILGRFGRDGRPLLQSFFGSLFTYLYPTLLVDVDGERDAFNTNWDENTREAIVANFAFGQAHPEAGYSRLFWGISASDGPTGYQGLYGAPPLDLGAGGVVHDGTIAPYALAGSLPFAADLALPALQNLMTLQSGRLMDRYGLKGGVNLQQDFFANEYLGLDQGALLLGLDGYQSNRIAQLVRRSPVVQRAMTNLGLHASPVVALEPAGPRSQHAYVLIDSAEHLTQTVRIARPALPASGDLLLELHPFGIDTARNERFVDVDLAVNGQPVKTLRFQDSRGTGVVDVGSVYVPIPPAMLAQATNDVTLTWVGGERWVQIQDVELSGPTGRLSHQETWQIGQRDGSFHEFGDERLVNDSYLVGDDPKTFEQALNVVDEPITDILFELQDIGVDRLVRLVASETQDGKAVTVEVSVNGAVAGQAILRSGQEQTVAISALLLRTGWNHLRLRHANVPGDGEFISWDMIACERQTGTGAFQVLVRNVQDNQLAPAVQFGLAGPQGDVISAQQYLEIHYPALETLDRITIATENRTAPIHRFTGPADVSAAGLVGEADSAIVAPLLWQVYDERQPGAPPFTGTVQWAYVPDISDPSFSSTEAINYRSVVTPSGLGDRPTAGRGATSPVVVYFAADFLGKPAQRCGTDRLQIEIIQQ